MQEDMNDWQAAQFRDECLRLQQIDQILRSAERRPLQADEIEILAHEAGLGEFTKETK